MLITIYTQQQETLKHKKDLELKTYFIAHLTTHGSDDFPVFTITVNLLAVSGPACSPTQRSNSRYLSRWPPTALTRTLSARVLLQATVDLLVALVAQRRSLPVTISPRSWKSCPAGAPSCRLPPGHTALSRFAFDVFVLLREVDWLLTLLVKLKSRP